MDKCRRTYVAAVCETTYRFPNLRPLEVFAPWCLGQFVTHRAIWPWNAIANGVWLVRWIMPTITTAGGWRRRVEKKKPPNFKLRELPKSKLSCHVAGGLILCNLFWKIMRTSVNWKIRRKSTAICTVDSNSAGSVSGQIQNPLDVSPCHKSNKQPICHRAVSCEI